MTHPNRKPEDTCEEDARALSISDEGARAVRDRLHGAKTRADVALKYTMWSEIREELCAAQADLAAALAHLGG